MHELAFAQGPRCFVVNQDLAQSMESATNRETLGKWEREGFFLIVLVEETKLT